MRKEIETVWKRSVNDIRVSSIHYLETSISSLETHGAAISQLKTITLTKT